jgi:hypothetical protein
MSGSRLMVCVRSVHDQEMTRTWNAAAIAIAITAASLLTTSALPAATAVAAGRAAQAKVPWSKVGPGWVLDEYTVTFPKAGPAELYLFSPQGTRYQLASWPDSDTAPQLVAWSPDGTRALLTTYSTHPHTEQLTLATGKTTTVTLPDGTQPIGYTTPHGTDIVAGIEPARPCCSDFKYYLYGQDGVKVRSLGGYPGAGILYTPAGTEFATGGRDGLQLVSSDGVVLRQLPVPGMDSSSCNAVRWWNGSTILAVCYPPAAPGYLDSIGGAELWLVPVSGARSTVLTGAAAPNEGDTDAWQLDGGLYLNYFWEHGRDIKKTHCSNCGLVSVPGLADNADPQVLTAAGSRLLVVANSSYASSSGQLLWFDPATRTEQWLTRVPANVQASSTAISFRSETVACAGLC